MRKDVIRILAAD